jgi:DNA polymerase-1
MLTVNWPAVRQIFIPDPGWVFFDIDLAGADAQVVAWEAGDEDLKAAFKNKVKIHIKNGCDIWGREVMYSKDPDGKSEPYYTRVKRGVHLTNYGGQISTLAKKCAMSNFEANKFQTTWFSLHPPISAWHEKTMFDIQTTGRTSNRFGYSIDWFDRPSLEIWRAALAWIPQSTIARVTEIAMVAIRKVGEDTRMRYNSRRVCKLVMQVHDSIVFGVRLDAVSDVLPIIHAILHAIVIPYDDPLIIPWGIKRGRTSWGECKEISWESVLNEGTRELAERISPIHGGNRSPVRLPPLDGNGDPGGSGTAQGLDRPSPLPMGRELVRTSSGRAGDSDEIHLHPDRTEPTPGRKGLLPRT